MKQADLITKKKVVIPAHVAVEILAHDVTNVYVTYNAKSERFKFKTTMRNEKSDRIFITNEQLKKLLPSVITEKREVTKKTEKTKAITIKETLVINDILEDCITPVDCFNAILRVLKKTELTSVNSNTDTFNLFAKSPTASDIKNLKAYFKLDDSYHDIKKFRRPMNATEIFTAEDAIESATPQILDKELHSMY